MKLSELCVLFPHSIVVLFLSKQMMLNYRKSHLLLITMSRIGLRLLVLYKLPQGTIPFKTMMEFSPDIQDILYFFNIEAG